MTHPIENCPKYTAEQVEAMAADLRDAPGTSMLGTHISVSTGKAVAMYEVLTAYAATLRQQGEQDGGVVSRDLLAIACQARNKESERARKAGLPRNETAELRAALEAVAPLLRAPAEQGGRVDDVILREAADEALTLLQQLDPQHGITTQLQAALAQIAQGETPNKRATGVYHKFNVTRTDGSDRPGGKHEGCDYFVLDLTHDPFAKPAATAYADACESEYSVLAADMRKRYGLHAERARVPDGWMLVPKDIHPQDEIVDCSGIRGVLNQRPGFRLGFSDELSLIASWWEQITDKAPQPPTDQFQPEDAA